MYATVIVLVLYGCETWCVTLSEEYEPSRCAIYQWYIYFKVVLKYTMEEHALMVCENRVLRGIFGLKREEVTRGW